MIWDMFKNKGIIIAGLRGSGKTTLVKEVAKRYKTLVYAENVNEYLDLSDNVGVFKYDNFINDIEYVNQKILSEWHKEIDIYIIDGFDLLFTHHMQKVSETFNNLWISMRHLGIGIILITRRPQDIPARVWNSADYLISFHFNIPAYLDFLKRIEMGLDTKVKTLKEHEFIIKNMQSSEEAKKYKLKL